MAKKQVPKYGPKNDFIPNVAIIQNSSKVSGIICKIHIYIDSENFISIIESWKKPSTLRLLCD